MPKRLTQEIFLTRCREKWGDKFDLSRVQYKGASVKVEIGCERHGWQLILPGRFLLKHGCPECGKAARGPEGMTYPEFLEKVNKKFANKYTYSHCKEFDLKTSSLQIVCPIHGEFTQIARRHWESEAGCTECGHLLAGERRLISKDEFITRSTDQHGDRFSYSKITIEVEEGKANRQVRNIYCNQHEGYFDHDMSSHLRGVGCPVCHWRDKTTEDFIREAIEQHGNKYTYENAHYTTWDGLVSVTCPAHGDWNVKAYAHTRKDGKATGCPVCGSFIRGYSGLNHFKANPDYALTPCELYLVEIENFWKIGIAADTNKRDHKFQREVLYKRLSTRGNVWAVEQKLLIDSLFAKPEILPPKFNDWAGRLELRNAGFMDQDELINMIDDQLDECEEVGWQKYIDSYYVADINLF